MSDIQHLVLVKDVKNLYAISCNYTYMLSHGINMYSYSKKYKERYTFRKLRLIYYKCICSTWF